MGRVVTIRGDVRCLLRYDIVGCSNRLGGCQTKEGIRMKRLVVISTLACCSGCSVLVQNRYSVLGIEAGEIDSLAEAKFWSVALLVGVAIVSALLAVLVFWLGQKWLARRRLRAKEAFLAGSAAPPAETQTGPLSAGETSHQATEGAFASKR